MNYSVQLSTEYGSYPHSSLLLALNDLGFRPASPSLPFGGGLNRFRSQWLESFDFMVLLTIRLALRPLSKRRAPTTVEYPFEAPYAAHRRSFFSRGSLTRHIRRQVGVLNPLRRT